MNAALFQQRRETCIHVRAFVPLGYEHFSVRFSVSSQKLRREETLEQNLSEWRG